MTVRGRVAFTDVGRGTHPVSNVSVLLFDAEPGADRQLAATSTDTEGLYVFRVPNLDADATGIDAYVIARAEGETVRVSRHDSDAVHEIASSLTGETTDLPGGEEVTIDLTASNDIGRPNNVAFEIYEAVNLTSRFLSTYEAQLPARVTVRYPRTDNVDSSVF